METSSCPRRLYFGPRSQAKKKVYVGKKLISPRIELGTFCVLSRCHNQLDHETNLKNYVDGTI